MAAARVCSSPRRMWSWAAPTWSGPFDSLLASGLLNGRTDRFAAPSHPRKDGSKLIRLYLQAGRSAESDPLTPRSLSSTWLSPNNLPSFYFPTIGRSQHRLSQVFSQRTFKDTSPTKIVMNPASPCGPPRLIKPTGISFSVRYRLHTGEEWRFKAARYGVDQAKRRCFLVSSAHMQFLFISRCGGSVIRLPWRLPRYTLAYNPPTEKKKSASASVIANSVSSGWVKICLCPWKISVSLM